LTRALIASGWSPVGLKGAFSLNQRGLVPVGGGGGLNAAKAAEVISLLEPNIVIPMHYATSEAQTEAGFAR
jgi:hypothetical protein